MQPNAIALRLKQSTRKRSKVKPIDPKMEIEIEITRTRTENNPELKQLNRIRYECQTKHEGDPKSNRTSQRLKVKNGIVNPKVEPNTRT